MPGADHAARAQRSVRHDCQCRDELNGNMPGTEERNDHIGGNGRGRMREVLDLVESSATHRLHRSCIYLPKVDQLIVAT